MEKKDLNKFIKESLENIEVKPAISSFEISMRKLAAEQKRKKRLVFFWWFTGFILLGGTALFLFSGDAGKEINSSTITAINNDANRDNKKYQNAKNYQEEKSGKTQGIEPSSEKTEPVSANQGVLPKPFYIYKKAVTLTKKDSSARSILNDAEKVKLQLNETELKYLKMELSKTPMVSFSKHKQRDSLMRGADSLFAGKAEPNDSAKPEKKKSNFVWYIGIGGNPQLSNYQTNKNDNRSQIYDANSGGSFTEFYLEKRREQAKFGFTYHAAVKGGFIYNRKWMVHTSLGYQLYKYKETSIKQVVSPAPVPLTTLSPSPGMDFSADDTEFKNSFNYIQSSLEVCRIVDFGSFGLKIGVGFSASRLISANSIIVDGYNSSTYRNEYKGEKLNKMLYASSARVGVLRHITSRIQLQASPNVYYNFNSMFDKKYLITQRPYGVGFDMSLMIRIN